MAARDVPLASAIEQGGDIVYLPVQTRFTSTSAQVFFAAVIILLSASNVMLPYLWHGRVSVFSIVVFVAVVVLMPMKLANLPQRLVRHVSSRSYVLTTLCGRFTVPFAAVTNVMAIDGWTFAPIWKLGMVKGCLTEYSGCCTWKGIKICTTITSLLYESEIYFSPTCGGQGFYDEHVQAMNALTSASRAGLELGDSTALTM